MTEDTAYMIVRKMRDKYRDEADVTKWVNDFPEAWRLLANRHRGRAAPAWAFEDALWDAIVRKDVSLLAAVRTIADHQLRMLEDRDTLFSRRHARQIREGFDEFDPGGLGS